MTVDVMKVWREMPLKEFFLIDDQLFQKNSATTALHVSTQLLGELYIGPVQARAIRPYTPEPGTLAPVAPRDPEQFETKVVERPTVDPNFGATTVTVTPVETKIETAIQPPPGTGRRKKAKRTETGSFGSPPA